MRLTRLLQIDITKSTINLVSPSNERLDGFAQCNNVIKLLPLTEHHAAAVR